MTIEKYDMALDFIDFVKTMPESKEIDHSSLQDENPWCNCAVGEFLRKEHNVVLRHTEPGYDEEPIRELEDALEAHGWEMVTDCLSSYMPTTYGQLAVIFEALQAGLVDGHRDEWEDSADYWLDYHFGF